MCVEVPAPGGERFADREDVESVTGDGEQVGVG